MSLKRPVCKANVQRQQSRGLDIISEVRLGSNRRNNTERFVSLPMSEFSCVRSACLVDDDLGGVFGRVCCIGERSVRASKQWVPEKSSKFERWLVQCSHICNGGQVFLTAQRNIGRFLLTGSSLLQQIPVVEQLFKKKTTSSARPHIQKHLGKGEPRCFQQPGPGPQIFYRLACNWPGPPEIARPCWQRKSAQGGPLEKEKRCKAQRVRDGCKLEKASGHM